MNQATQNEKRSGQAMLIAVLSLGGAILGATAIAGFLTLYQIRTTADTENSAKAIFAADAGTEWAQFEYYNNSNISLPTFLNGASTTVNCYAGSSGLTSSTLCSDPTSQSAISTGVSLDSERAFFLGLSTATSSYP